jgi:endonuclease III related protein
MGSAAAEQQIRAFYNRLYAAWGPQHWWPAKTRFEVIVGAYLTQNTAWKNVEIALRNLRKAGLLTLAGVRRVPTARLEALIRPSGYFRQKASRLKTFVTFVDERYVASLAKMLAQPTGKLREELLELNGVGPETADSILLYAGQHPVFVVDAYTRRIFERHGIAEKAAGYEDIRSLCEQALDGLSAVARGDRQQECARPSTAHSPSAMSCAKRPVQAQVFNDMHGLLVGVGKHYCLKAEPNCQECPLKKFLP